MIYEDTDLNLRAQIAGWKVLYVPTAVVRHKVRSSIGTMTDMAVYYSLRNSELVRMKCVPFGIFIRCCPEISLNFVLEFVYFCLLHHHITLFFKAKMDALKMLPRVLKKRKKIMSQMRVSNRYLLTLMTPVWERSFFNSKLGKFLHE